MKCDWCKKEGMLYETYDGDLLCQGCYEIATSEKDGYCEVCGEPIEEDPYCLMCNRDLCEVCYQKHLPACQKINNLGKSQCFITEWIGKKEE